MENKSPGSCSSIISSSTPGPGGSTLMNSKAANGGSPDSTTANSSGGSGIGASIPRSSSPTPNMYSLKWNTQLVALQRSLANLWDNGIGTDAVLLCQGTPLPVHKIVLTAASPYVASVVQTMAQAAHMMPVIVVDIPAEAGKALLSFLYCGEAHVPVNIIPHLVVGAKFLGISGFGDPGVLESLTGMVPDQTPGRETTHGDVNSKFESHHHTQSNSKSEPGDSHHIPHVQLPIIPLPLPLQVPSHLSSSVQMKKSAAMIERHERSKSRSPFATPSSYLSPGDSGRSNSSSPYNNSNGATNLSMKKNNNNTNNSDSPRTNVKGQSSTNIRGGGRVYIGTTSILDNLLKNPRGGQYPDQNSASNEASDNSEMVQYEAEGYNESGGGAGQNHPTYYYSPNAGAGISIGGHSVFEDDAAPIDMSDTDHAPIPAQLLEPNVEYHIGNEFTDRFGGIQHPLADLAKVTASVQQQGGGGASKRRGTKAQQQQQQQGELAGNGVEIISSTGGRHPVDTPPPVKIKIKKPPETITCDICSKRFSNAYNLRVHMEGHSGQVFVCSVCSHASRSRDALRKHFAYRHRELWISGMSAFRKNVPGRKLSISKPNPNNNNNDNNNKNNNNNNNNNNNTIVKMETGDMDSTRDNSNPGGGLVDANGNINLRGTDGTLTISEAYPEQK